MIVPPCALSFTRATPRIRRRSPSMLSAPLAIHGVSAGPTLTRPSATSSHAPLLEDPVQPDPALGVLGAPVVADHAAPAVELPVLDAAGDRRVGQRALELRARERRAVQPRRQVLEGRGGGAEGQIPLRGSPQCLGPPARAGRAEVAVADRQPVAGARIGERLLDRARLAPGLEQRAPQRAGRRAARALEDRVADPGAAAALRIRGAQVVRLVVALGGRDGGEARLAHRFPWRSPSHSHSG